MAPPRVLLDANVLVPSILRETLLGAAAAGAFVPLWSARILEEWARAARRLPEGAEAVARAEAAAMRAAWPAAEVPPDADLEARLALPDPNDVHVLAAAIAGGAAVILTLDREGFPGRAIARHGLIARAPDGFLFEIHVVHDLGPVVAAVQARAEATAGRPRGLRPMLKRAGLPRLGKALAGAG
jgi:predicted nucleic acid-binding protein